MRTPTESGVNHLRNHVCLGVFPAFATFNCIKLGVACSLFVNATNAHTHILYARA